MATKTSRRSSSMSTTRKPATTRRASTKMTVSEAGQKGGRRTAQTRGREFYSKIGQKGGAIGGRKGGQRVRELVGAGKSRERKGK